MDIAGTSGMHELILGGQKSGKSRAAEARAACWLQRPGREAVLVATAQPADEDLAARIERHRRDRAMRVPSMSTCEEARDLAGALRRLCAAHRLVVVDCLTLWLTQLAMPIAGPGAEASELAGEIDRLAGALREAAGPVVLVSNEIGLGVAPMSPEARRFVDALGLAHQAVAAACERVTLMVAGCEVPVKGARS